MSSLDELWASACERDTRAFGDWMGCVERPIRVSLHRWARVVEVESIVQEALVRMWIRASDAQAAPLTGEHASLRFAIRLAHNLARNESRKRRREDVRAPSDMPELDVPPDPAPDPLLRGLIRACLDALSGRVREALVARLVGGPPSNDAALAEALGMKLNTFLQNIVRARRQLEACLASKGYPEVERTR